MQCSYARYLDKIYSISMKDLSSAKELRELVIMALVRSFSNALPNLQIY